MCNKINTVIFDIGNVLVDFCWQKAFSNMRLSPEIFERLRVATVGDNMWSEFDRGELSLEEIVDGFIKNDPELEPVIRDFIDNHYGEIAEGFDYSKEWIRTLKSHGYKVYFLSNFSELGFKVFADILDFIELGDGAVISYEVKLVKPDKRIYNILLDKYNINPDEAVFIDDTPVNIEAANSLGIHGILFKDRQQVLDDLESLGVS